MWDLQVIPLDSPVAEPAQVVPESENAFICHLENHWFCIRKVNGEWYNFDSLLPAPQHLSKFYLSAYLDSLKGFGWSIFLVRGNFPKECPLASSEASNCYGQWLTPEDAERINKSCSNSTPAPQRPSAQQPSGQTLDPRDAEALAEFEDEELKAAIAASLMDSSPAIANAEAARQEDPSPAMVNRNAATERESSPAKANTDCERQVDSSLVTGNRETVTLDGSSQAPVNTEDPIQQKDD